MNLSVRDAAKLLNIAEKTIYRWIKQGSLPAYKVNEQYRFNRAELLEWATSRKINVAPEIFQEPEATSTKLPGLVEALETGGIFYRLPGTDKESALRAIVQHLRVPEEVDKEFLFKVMMAREAMGSTGIGEGVAIPHVRNPIVLHVNRPHISLCFLEKPIEFSALDGKPVFALFTIISPTVRAHLHMLSRLSFALSDPGFKKVLGRQGSSEEILKEALKVESKLGQKNPSSGTGEGI
jgi:PTS system nitrogen regulatory IIA component